jgi:hypothetical protein
MHCILMQSINYVPNTRGVSGRWFVADTRTGMLLGLPRSAICVQGFDESQNSAIHMIYHILLCPSSIGEPRYPMLKVVFLLFSTISFGVTLSSRREERDPASSMCVRDHLVHSTHVVCVCFYYDFAPKRFVGRHTIPTAWCQRRQKCKWKWDRSPNG